MSVGINCMTQLEYASLLLDNFLTITLVRPAECLGLDDFADRDVLRLDVGRATALGMRPAARPDGLQTLARFDGVHRTVFVPWSAVMWAGSGEDYARAQRRSEGAAAPPALRAEPARSNVVRVDFQRRRRAGAP